MACGKKKASKKVNLKKKAAKQNAEVGSGPVVTSKTQKMNRKKKGY